MSIKDVKDSENCDLLDESAEGLVYDDTIVGYPVFAVYLFTDNKLTNGSYLFNQEHSNYNKFYEDYLVIKEAYTKVYGEPTRDFEHWYDDFYKDDPSNWGMAIAKGEFVCISEWTMQRGTVILRCGGDNFEIDISCVYYSTDYQSEEDYSGI